MNSVEPKSKSRTFQDLSGRKFGRWTVLCQSQSKPVRWKCVCECGTEKSLLTQPLTRGMSKSCGCLRREVTTARRTSHGMSHTKLFRVWCGMLERCERPKHVGYARYGGRGIRVCERWHSFEAFYADMGPRPSDKHQLDRIDSNGNYEPGNCRWASMTQNARNTSKNRVLEFRGESRCISEWAEITGIRAPLISQRIAHGGWSVEDALTTPSRGNYLKRT